MTHIQIQATKVLGLKKCNFVYGLHLLKRVRVYRIRLENKSVLIYFTIYAYAQYLGLRGFKYCYGSITLNT